MCNRTAYIIIVNAIKERRNDLTDAAYLPHGPCPRHATSPSSAELHHAYFHRPAVHAGLPTSLYILSAKK